MIDLHSRQPLLIQIVPQLKPGRCGVSDHALPLAAELKASFAMDSAFAVLNSDERNPVPHRVLFGSQQNLSAICNELAGDSPAAVLVHLSGYGYAPNGAPVQLAQSLSQLAGEGKFPIAVYFHELFTQTWPWRSSFWARRKQIQVVRSMAENASLLLTSISRYTHWLNTVPRRKPGATVLAMPLFSTCGESIDPLPATRREPSMAIFGLEPTRRRAYKELRVRKHLLRDLQVDCILDIGPGKISPDSLAGVPVKRLGPLSVPDLAHQLDSIRFGYLSYTAPFIGKSSVFAGYCAHAVIPIIPTPFSGEVDGLKDGAHLLTEKSAPNTGPAQWDRCALTAWRWYAVHNLHTYAAALAGWVNRQMSDRRDRDPARKALQPFQRRSSF